MLLIKNCKYSIICFNFKQITIIYLKAPNHDFSRLAYAIMTAANEKKISIRTVQVYRQPYYYGDILENITRNPFLDIVRETYKDTRSKLRNMIC